MGTVYLLHFDQKYKHAQHYLGWSDDGNLQKRLTAHRKGHGSRLLQVIREAKIGWQCVRTWENVDRNFERALKNKKATHRFCPVCRGGRLTQDLKMVSLEPTQQIPF